MRVIVRAWNKDGRHQDILIADGQLVRMKHVRLTDGFRGILIDPSLFPEMVKFEVIIEDDTRR